MKIIDIDNIIYQEEFKTKENIIKKMLTKVTWVKNEDPVKYIMLILIPKKNSDFHINILKDISTKLINENFRKKLENVKSVLEIYEVLNI